MKLVVEIAENGLDSETFAKMCAANKKYRVFGLRIATRHRDGVSFEMPGLEEEETFLATGPLREALASVYHRFYEPVRPTAVLADTAPKRVEVAMAAFGLGATRLPDAEWLQLISVQAFNAKDKSLPREVLAGEEVTRRYHWWKLADSYGTGREPSRRKVGKSRFEVTYLDLETGTKHSRHVEAWDQSRALLKAFGRPDTATGGTHPKTEAERLKVEVGALSVKPASQRYQLIGVARITASVGDGLENFMVEEDANELR